MDTGQPSRAGEPGDAGDAGRIGEDPAATATAFCDLLLAWGRRGQAEPAGTVPAESLRSLVSPLSGWESDRGLGLAREIIAAIGSPVYDIDAEHAPGRPDVCWFRILEPAAGGRVPGSVALVLTLIRCGDGRWRIHGIGDPVPAAEIPRPE